MIKNKGFLFKFIIVLLGVFILVLLIEGSYFLYLKYNEKTNFFNGTDYYEKIGFKQTLLVSEGTIIDIDRENLSLEIKNKENTKTLKYQEQDEIFLINSNNRDQTEKIGFLDIRIGDFLAYNPIKGERGQSIWLVEHYE